MKFLLDEIIIYHKESQDANIKKNANYYDGVYAGKYLKFTYNEFIDFKAFEQFLKNEEEHEKIKEIFSLDYKLLSICFMLININNTFYRIPYSAIRNLATLDKSNVKKAFKHFKVPLRKDNELPALITANLLECCMGNEQSIIGYLKNLYNG